MTELIQFKAGKVDYNEQTKQCTPKRGTGLIKVTKNPEDPMLYSFIWEPRGNYKTVAGPDTRDELLLFPGDAQWTHVKQCTTGRVFALKFKSSGQKLVFWLQSPTDGENLGELSAEDKRISAELRKLLEEPAAQPDDSGDIELHDAPADNESSGANNPPIPNLQDLLRSINVPGRQSMQAEVPVTSIGNALPQSVIVEYVRSLSDDELAPLYNHLPEGIEHSHAELIRVIQSSQFAQGMGLLSSVLNQGGGQVVASQLGYPYSGEGVEGFLEGVRREREDDDDEDRMED